MKFLKKLSLILTTMLIVFSLVACGQKSNETSITEESSYNNEENKETGKEVLDREGNSIVLPEKIDRIISLAPSITETLVDLGLSDKLVAVDKYSLEVEGVNKDLPVFDIMAPDAEQIVALESDVIFGTGMSKANSTDPFAPIVEMGTFVTVIPTSNSIQGIIDDIKFIGLVTKTEEKANEIVSNFESELKEITDKIENANLTEEKTVYFETSPAPSAYSFGSNVFLNEFLDMLKVKNIFADQEGWLSVSEEQVVDKNPDIIFTNAGYLEDVVNQIKNRAGWENINAVKNDKIYVIDSSSSRANENSIKAFKEMAAAIYPELFS